MNNSIGRTPAGSKRILVVEDAQSVAEFIREMLLAFGHQPEVLMSVHQALAAFEPGKYDLIITDYTMPVMNGIDFARRIRERSPGQLILLITGSSFSLTDGAPDGTPINAVLQKPFSVAEFQDTLALMLAPRPKPVLVDTKGLNQHEPAHPASREPQSPVQGSLRGLDERAPA
jgi:CheY-like chemotaxis protein